jgi:hypothetical protein
MIFNWHPASAAQALLLRIWALLFIPVNWSIAPLVWLRIALTVMLVCFALAVLASRAIASTPSRHLLAALAFTIAAALPVFPLLRVAQNGHSPNRDRRKPKQPALERHHCIEHDDSEPCLVKLAGLLAPLHGRF